MSTTDGFKMIEKAPYEQHDSKALTEAAIDAAKVIERVYGPAFTAKVIKYALRAVATLTGEQQQPEDIKTLDQLTSYLLSKSEKLPAPPYNIAHWAVYVTEKKLEGSLGAGYQMGWRGYVKEVMGSGGKSNLQAADIDKALSEIRHNTVEMRIAPFEMGYKKNGDGSLEVIHRGCAYQDGCQMSVKDTLLKRPDARLSCGNVAFICQSLKAATGCDWDHTVLELAKTGCRCRVFMI